MTQNMDDPGILRSNLEVIYDLYRKALFNRKYYGDRLSAIQKHNTVIEIVIALGTAAGVGGLVFWEGATGQIAWGTIAGLAVMLNVIRPVIQWPKKIELYSKLFASYSAMYGELGSVVSEIRTTRKLSPENLKTYSDAQLHAAWLSVDDDPRPSSKLLERYYKDVNDEIPFGDLWVPA
jgi:hypothetical protein